MYSLNMTKGIEKYWDDKIAIKEVQDFEVYGKKFKLVLSTPVADKKYKYLNCYEEKLNGLYYKSYQAAKQGGSNALISFSMVYVNREKASNKENWFTVVYGYNKDLMVNSYEMKIDGHEKSIVSSIAGKEYFIDTFKGGFEKLVNVVGRDGSDMFQTFYD